MKNSFGMALSLLITLTFGCSESISGIPSPISNQTQTLQTRPNLQDESIQKKAITTEIQPSPSKIKPQTTHSPVSETKLNIEPSPKPRPQAFQSFTLPDDAVLVDMAIDKQNQLFVIVEDKPLIYRYNQHNKAMVYTGGKQTLLNGKLTDNPFDTLRQISFNSKGELYVLDQSKTNSYIRKVTSEGVQTLYTYQGGEEKGYISAFALTKDDQIYANIASYNPFVYQLYLISGNPHKGRMIMNRTFIDEKGEHMFNGGPPNLNVDDNDNIYFTANGYLHNPQPQEQNGRWKYGHNHHISFVQKGIFTGMHYIDDQSFLYAAGESQIKKQTASGTFTLSYKQEQCQLDLNLSFQTNRINIAPNGDLYLGEINPHHFNFPDSPSQTQQTKIIRVPQECQQWI